MKTALDYLREQTGWADREKYAGRTNQRRIVAVEKLVTRLGLRRSSDGVLSSLSPQPSSLRATVQEIVTQHLGAGFVVGEVTKTHRTRRRGKHTLTLRAPSAVHRHEAQAKLPALLAALAPHAIQEIVWR